MKSIYEIPNSLKELFENKNSSYRIINYDKGMDMDNIQAMNHFLESVGISSEQIELHDGTQVFLTHPDYNYLAVVNSGGLGDFFSHGFDVSFVKKVNGSFEDFNP